MWVFISFYLWASTDEQILMTWTHDGVVPAERCAHSSEEALHQSGDGQSPDGEEPV